jgi:hypothetical protein
MRYILDSEGYIEEIAFGSVIECNNNSCTEYTGSIPTGYESLCEWADNANIRAYYLVDGNLTYDSVKDQELQAKWEQELQNRPEGTASTHTITTAGTDLNDYKTDGIYYFNNAVTPVNIPTGSNGFLQVMVGINATGNEIVKQIWHRHGTANTNDYQTFVRIYTSDTWSNWKQYKMVDDTGWINAELSDGVTANAKGGNDVPQYRKIDSRIIIRGAVETTWEGSGTTKKLFSLPAEYMPTANIYKIIATGGTRLARLIIGRTGVVSIEWVVNISDGSYVTGSQWFDISCDFEL